MGWFSKAVGVVAAGYVAKRTHNAISRPVVIMQDPDYELVSMKARGTGRWKIRYRRKGSISTSSTTVSRNTTHTTHGGGIEIHWPD